MSVPAPGSTLTTTTVMFTGGHDSQPGEEHFLSVGTGANVFANLIFHEFLSTGHDATVSGLPTSGTLHVRYWTMTTASSPNWLFKDHTYTMNVPPAPASDNHTLRWDQAILGAQRFALVMPTTGTPAGEAVLDRNTGLAWEQSPLVTAHTSALARSQCLGRTVGGQKGWRLPSVHELASLIDPTNPGGNPDLPPVHPFSNVQSAGYWSATTDADNPTSAWALDFTNGGLVSLAKTSSFLAWCVRGGGPLSQY